MFETFRPARVLLVEDDVTDAELLKLEFERHKFHAAIEMVNDCEQALDYIFQRNSFCDKPTPDLILLDLYLPGIGGLEVLKEIKQNQKTTLIPVAVLTGSGRDEDLLSAYNNLADCFLKKPLSFIAFLDFLRQTQGLWMNLAVSEPSKV